MDTFIIRLWVPDTGVEPDLCGIVEHVRSGGQTVFQGREELLAALAERRAGPDPPPQPCEPARPAPTHDGEGLARLKMRNTASHQATPHSRKAGP